MTVEADDAVEAGDIRTALKADGRPDRPYDLLAPRSRAGAARC